MSDEVVARYETVIRSGKSLRIGDVDWIVTEPINIPTACPDLLIDTRQFNGVIVLTLGETRVEGSTREVAICSRMRMDLVAAQVLHQTLGNLISQAQKPVEKAQAN